MDDVLGVRVRHRVDNGDHGRQQRQSFLERLLLGERLRERAARDELHRVERTFVVGLARIVDRDDRRMLQPRGDQRLAYEPRLRAGIGREQLLHGDQTIEIFVARAQDAAEPAAPDLTLDLVALAIESGQGA